MPALVAERLSKHYGRARAVDAVSFEVARGEIVGFLGPNGAGKTTTLRMLTGLIRPTSGRARVLGAAVPGPSLREVGTMIEEPSFYPYMTGRANLKHAALLHGGVSEARIDETLRFVKLDNAAKKRVQAYSQGMRQRLGLARALLWRPRVLILDEPTNGLDPVGIAEIRENLRAIAREGVTVLISSHILAEIEKLAPRVLVIERGRLRFDGPLAQLTRRLAGARVSYVLEATDSAALQAALARLGYQADTLGVAHTHSGRLRASLPEGEASALLSRLAGEGVLVTEARRLEDSLEDAYLRLLREDGRPS
ncbi:N/A [soil metagenome]|jgi:ABC-2 type transport system ATP-binding protein|nr:ATP-binding cassette domain-containing protein [Deinococcota bacterium]